MCDFVCWKSKKIRKVSFQIKFINTDSWMHNQGLNYEEPSIKIWFAFVSVAFLSNKCIFKLFSFFERENEFNSDSDLHAFSCLTVLGI